jgi:hypothetical protein
MLPQRLANTLVQVILLEIANRSATTEPAPIPQWLIEGMAAQIQAADPTVLIQPFRRTDGTRLVAELVKPLLLIDPRQLARDPRLQAKSQRIRSKPVFTFEELSWPNKELSNDPVHTEMFQASAHLFVYQLLNLENGRRNLSRFLATLPNHLNWQISFLESFSDQFYQLRDVEKWWGLISCQPGNIGFVRWTPAQSAEYIRDALLVPTQKWNAQKNVSETRGATLQDVILSWSVEAQIPAIRKAWMNLLMLRPRLDPAFVPLVDQYCLTLQKYLQKHAPEKRSWLRSKNISTRARNSEIRQMAQLDAKLATLQSPQTATAAPKNKKFPALRK